MLTSTRTRRGFRAPARRRVVAAPSLPLLAGSGAAWAFVDDRAVVPAADVVPVRIAPVIPIRPVAATLLAPAPAAPAAPDPRIPAGAASVRVAHEDFPFRVVVVDLESGDDESVLVAAASPLAARRECSDEFGAPVAVYAVLPGGAEELVWGAAA
ncbi:MAG: hypothetical protein IPK85_02960 [Gemmatimonadetes bacterium]|nr:hypothetical protein [Gemmatimonadota bacterium]